MVEHRHRLTPWQKKWLSERELRGEVARPTLAERVSPELASDRIGYWEHVERLGVIEDAIEAAEQAMEAADRLQRGGSAVAAMGRQAEPSNDKPRVVIKRRF